eukprot:gnl/Chilomastix_caulleri/444.p1 GENE.gnl/Chilomastix_caulleri/444~~gnl/Chilomastix_caulleri/444.p1  ORF type:complete len:185 (+),score=50.94 gnl/Chilomastix_caulleri/444:151-705(+)
MKEFMPIIEANLIKVSSQRVTMGKPILGLELEGLNKDSYIRGLIIESSSLEDRAKVLRVLKDHLDIPSGSKGDEMIASLFESMYNNVIGLLPAGKRKDTATKSEVVLKLLKDFIQAGLANRNTLGFIEFKSSEIKSLVGEIDKSKELDKVKPLQSTIAAGQGLQGPRPRTKPQQKGQGGNIQKK